MNNDLYRARELLLQGHYTCVLCHADSLRTDIRRGVMPLVSFLQEGTWTGYSAADKVVGKATAFLYVLMDIRAVYAPVMSSAAIRILRDHHIDCCFETEVEAVFNRSRTGLCPMESAVRDIGDPQRALTAITQTLQQMRSQHTSREGAKQQ